MPTKKVVLENKTLPCMPENYIYDERRFYFPVNSNLVKSLIGKILTQIESMNLSERGEEATKDIFKQMVWRWWSDVQENSITSTNGCIGPIEHYDSAELPNGELE